MEDKEILIQAVKQAKKDFGYESDFVLEELVEARHDSKAMRFEKFYKHHIAIVCVRDIIFSHKFAKSFFGEEWQVRLQQMVLEENPIKYLAKFLK